MSKLDDILAEIDKGYVARPYKQEIKELFLELIGEEFSDTDDIDEVSAKKANLNSIEAKLRKKVEEL